MSIGQNVAVGADDEPGTQRAVLELLRHAGKIRNLAREKAAEQLLHGLVPLKLELVATAAPLDDLGSADIDHRRALLFHQFGEVGQFGSLCLRRKYRGKSQCEGNEKFLHDDSLKRTSVD